MRRRKSDNDIYIYSYLAYLSQIDSADELIKVFDISQSGYSTNDKGAHKQDARS